MDGGANFVHERGKLGSERAWRRVSEDASEYGVGLMKKNNKEKIIA
jgi:hypothetical protein